MSREWWQRHQKEIFILIITSVPVVISVAHIV